MSAAEEIAQLRKCSKADLELYAGIEEIAGADGDALSDALFQMMTRLDDLRIFAMELFDEDVPKSRQRRLARVRGEHIRSELKGVMAEIALTLRYNAIDQSIAEVAELKEEVENGVYPISAPVLRMKPPKESFMNPENTPKIAGRQRRKLKKMVKLKKKSP